MKKLLIIALLIVGCDNSTAPTVIHGCLDSQACNYDATATIDNNSCEYTQDLFTFNIYRNSELLITNVSNTDYTDLNMTLGTYCYTVTAVNELGNESENSNEACATTIDMQGCTDPDATNYNADANVDDGSCVYFELEYFTDLPTETGESYSSLVFVCLSTWFNSLFT